MKVASSQVGEGVSPSFFHFATASSSIVLFGLKSGYVRERRAVRHDRLEHRDEAHVPGHDRGLAALLARLHQGIRIDRGDHIEVARRTRPDG